MSHVQNGLKSSADGSLQETCRIRNTLKEHWVVLIPACRQTTRVPPCQIATATAKEPDDWVGQGKKGLAYFPIMRDCVLRIGGLRRRWAPTGKTAQTQLRARARAIRARFSESFDVFERVMRSLFHFGVTVWLEKGGAFMHG